MWAGDDQLLPIHMHIRLNILGVNMSNTTSKLLDKINSSESLKELPESIKHKIIDLAETLGKINLKDATEVYNQITTLRICCDNCKNYDGVIDVCKLCCPECMSEYTPL